VATQLEGFLSATETAVLILAAMETFVVRIWQPAPTTPAPLDALHGVVQHVGSDHEQPFKDDAELLAILRAPTESTRRAPS
jgi:hypothetical protein